MRLNTNLLLIVGISLLVFCILFPSFFLPFSLIDDGISIRKSQEIKEAFLGLQFSSFKQIFIEKDVGRFRPAYWIYHFLVYLVGGLNPAIHHFFRFVNFWLVSLLAYLVGTKISKSFLAGILGCLLFIFSFLGFENWLRLGPQEPLITLYFAMALWLFLKDNIILATILLIVSYLTKETAVAFLPVILFLLSGSAFFKKKFRSKLTFLFLFNLLIFLILLVIFQQARRAGGYSSYYSFDLSQMWKNTLLFVPLLKTYYGPFLFLPFIIFLFRRKIDKQFIWEMTLILSSLSIFLIQLPWPFTLGRYLLPALWAFSVFTGIQISRLFNYLGSFREKTVAILLKVGVLTLFFLTLLQNGVIMAGTFYDFYQREKINSQLIKFLAEKSLKNSKIFLNLREEEATIEYFEEIKLHLRLFYHQEDKAIDYLGRTKPERGSLVVSGWISPRYKEDELSMLFSLKKNYELQTNFKTPIVTSPTGFFKRVGEGTINFILKGERLSAEGIYTFYRGNYFWKVYEVI